MSSKKIYKNNVANFIKNEKKVEKIKNVNQKIMGNRQAIDKEH